MAQSGLMVVHSLDTKMQKTLINFMVVVLAVLAALFLYDKFHSSRTTGDFGVAALQERKKMLQSDFQRAADGAKTSVAEYYANRGNWPTKNEEAGLPTPDTYRGESLRKLEVNGNTLTLTFDARSGVDGGQIILTGEATPNFAMGINWTCVSPNIADIATIFPICKYAKP
jgi:hypothetical protein